MTNEQRHAHELYFQTQLTQLQIAEMLNIDRKTLYLWIKEGGWKQAKYAAEHAPSVLIQQYYEQLGAMNNHIASRAEQPWPSKEEAVIMRTITTTIKNISNGKHTVGESIEVFQHFTDKLRRKDLSLTKEVLPHMTNHIKDLSEEGKWLNFSHLRFEQEAFDKEYEAWVAQQQEADIATTAPSPLEAVIEVTPPSPLERAGAGERSLTQDTGINPNSQSPIPNSTPEPNPNSEILIPNSTPEANPNSQSPIPNPINDNISSPWGRPGGAGVSMGNSPISENQPEPATMAENTQNNTTDLPAKINENVDNYPSEITAVEPSETPVENVEEEETEESDDPAVLYPNDRWGQFLEERYNISQDPYVTRKNGITVIRSGSPLWQRGRGRSLFF